LLDLKLVTRSEIQKLVVAIGELFGKMIAKKMETVVKGYEFQKIEEATASLLGLS